MLVFIFHIVFESWVLIFEQRLSQFITDEFAPKSNQNSVGQHVGQRVGRIGFFYLYHEFGYLSLLAECFCFICAFKVAEYLSDPLCRGIFAGDSRLLSLSSCFPAVYQYENQHGSIIKGAFLTKEGTCIYISEGRLLEFRRSDPLLTIVDPSHPPPPRLETF